jgi:hypothetical protein
MPARPGGSFVVPSVFNNVFRVRTQPNVGPAPGLTSARGVSASSIRVGQQKGRLDIDYVKTRESMGYFSMMGLLGEIVADTKRTAKQAVATIAQNGDRMAAIHNKQNAIAQIAFQKMFADTKEFTIGFIPKVPPEIRYVPGGVNIDVVF